MRVMRILLAVSLSWPICLPATWAQNLPVKSDTGRFGDPTSIARAYQNYIYGVIKKIDIDRNEVVLDKTKFGVDQTYKLEPKTKYLRDGKPSSLAQLKVGDPVYVNAKKDKKTGAMVAKKVLTGITLTPAK